MPQAGAVSSGGAWVPSPGSPRVSTGRGWRGLLSAAAGKSVISSPVGSVVGMSPFAFPGALQHGGLEMPTQPFTPCQQACAPAVSAHSRKGCSWGTVSRLGLWLKPAPHGRSEARTLEVGETLKWKKLWLKTSGSFQGPRVLTPSPGLPGSSTEGCGPLPHCVALCGTWVSPSAWKQKRIHLAGSPGRAQESGGDLVLTSGASSRKTSSSGREGSRAGAGLVSGTPCSQSVGVLWAPAAGHPTAAASF